MKLSIVIPAHNEEHRLSPMLESYASFFSKKYGDEVELIVVPNSCADHTRAVACESASRFSQIQVLQDAGRVGKGGAIICGVEAARGDWIGFVDADGATAPAEFDRLAIVARGADGVIGSRWMRGSLVCVRQTAMRLLSSRLFNGLIRLLLGLRYVDTQCGAKIFSRAAWRAILPEIGITRFAFDVDVLFQLKRHGYEIREEPTVWKDVAGSKVVIMRTSLDMFLAVVRMRLLYSRFQFAIAIYERLFSRPFETLRRDRLFFHALVLFLSSLVAHACNAGYQWVVNGALSAQEYALLTTFLSLFAIVARPLETLSTTMNHYTSLLMQEGRTGTIRRLVKKWVLFAGAPALVVSAMSILFARPIAGLFGLTRVAPVLVFAASLPVLFVAPVVSGTVLGMQQFGWVALASIAGTLTRLGVGAAMVYLVYPACGWALVGHAGGMYLTLFFSAVVLGRLMRARSSDSEALPSFRSYMGQCFFIQLSMAILLNADVVFVRHFVPEDTQFAKAATLGRMVVFLTGAITASMFPKVVSTRRFTAEHRRIYLRGLAYAAAIAVGALVFCFLFPRPLLHFLFRVADPSEQMVLQTGWMALALFFAVLLSTNVSLLVAQRRFRGASVTVFCALCYVVGVCFFHGSALEVAAASGAASCFGLVVTTWLILRQKVEAGRA